MLGDLLLASLLNPSIIHRVTSRKGTAKGMEIPRPRKPWGKVVTEISHGTQQVEGGKDL